MARQHRVRIPRERNVTFDDRVAHLVVHAPRAELFELVMKIEHERWALEAPRGPAGARMQADDEKCLAAKTQRKVRIARIGMAGSAVSSRWSGTRPTR